MRRLAISLAAGCAMATLAAAPAHAFLLRGSVVGNGGQTGSNATHVLSGTVGQAAIGVGGNSTRILCSGFWCFGGVRVVAVGGGGGEGGGLPGAQLPKEIAFGMPSPNPSRGEVRFSLALPQAAVVHFAVYDVAGRQLGAEVAQSFGAGNHQLVWQAPAANAGVYFGVLRVDGALKVERRMVLVR